MLKTKANLSTADLYTYVLATHNNNNSLLNPSANFSYHSKFIDKFVSGGLYVSNIGN